jgi:hypothetical protein
MFGVDLEGPTTIASLPCAAWEATQGPAPCGFGNSRDGELEPYPHQKDTPAARERFHRNRSNVRWADGSRVDVACTTALVE